MMKIYYYSYEFKNSNTLGWIPQKGWSLKPPSFDGPTHRNYEYRNVVIEEYDATLVSRKSGSSELTWNWKEEQL